MTRAGAVAVAPAILAVLALRYLVPVEHRELVLGALLFLVFSALTRYWHARLARDGRPSASTPGTILGVLGAIGAAAALALALRTFVARPYRVDGPSMLPTLEPGDLVAGNVGAARSSRSLARGDVVVFGSLVKRVIGLPGDRVTMRGGAPVLDGWPVPECDAGEYLYVQDDVGAAPVHGRLRVEFLGDRAYLTVHSMTRSFADEYVVKPGEVFVLGDDRGNSLDSRSYGGGHGGGVPLQAIEARVDRFLVGHHRDGDADLQRVLRPLDALQTRVRLEGLDVGALDEGIARCLANRPAVTRPPSGL